MAKSNSDAGTFDYQASRDKVMIRARGRVVKTLKGADAAKFIEKVSRASNAEAQLVMAKVTGQFKFGNEKQ